jgi:hypothetical protein
MMPSPSKSAVGSPKTQSGEAGRARSRAQSISSEDSDSSRTTTVTKSSPFIPKRSLYEGQPNGSTASITSFSRPLPRPLDQAVRSPTADLNNTGTSSGWTPGHRPRQHSQGFFDPTIASASPINAPSMTGLTASQMAAQVAMHSQNSHMRKRSQTLPDPSAQLHPRLEDLLLFLQRHTCRVTLTCAIMIALLAVTALRLPLLPTSRILEVHLILYIHRIIYSYR